MAFLTHRDLLHPPLKRVQTLGQGRVGVDNILEKNESVPKFILEVGKDRMGECFFQTVECSVLAILITKLLQFLILGDPAWTVITLPTDNLLLNSMIIGQAACLPLEYLIYLEFGDKGTSADLLQTTFFIVLACHPPWV